MDNVRLELDANGHGKFVITDGETELGEMEVTVSGGQLTAHHTNVFPAGEGKGTGKKLFAGMVGHAREHHLTVIPHCSFVHAQLKKNAEQYSDIWKG
ncbi:MAG TPA: GNAT family N-acetyltransferase [Chitinophagaceae bacterium]